MLRRIAIGWTWVVLAVSGCAEGDASIFKRGDDGAASPLEAPPGESRAGRLLGVPFPESTYGMLTWEEGDFVIANDRVAMVIEDAGPSELYDPWGGRPVGFARVEAGALVDPADFGELFVVTGNNTVFTEHVGVISDGTDGGPAIVRAQGGLEPLPFFNLITAPVWTLDYTGIRAAIEYEMPPGADYVDIYKVYDSPFENTLGNGGPVLHGYMYTKRLPLWSGSGLGFDGDAKRAPFVAFADEDGTSFTYELLEGELGNLIAESGFVSNSSPDFDIPPGRSRIHHARLTIGGPGLDQVLLVRSEITGELRRPISGRVVDATGAPVAGARIHAFDTETLPNHLTRVRSAADGTFSLHVPQALDADLYVYREGDRLAGPFRVMASENESGDLAFDPAGTIVVAPTVESGMGPIPARIQVRPGPSNTDGLSGPFAEMGEPSTNSGFARVAYAMPSETTILRVPAGEWEVIVSHGFEYELHTEIVDVTGNNCDPELDLGACPTVSASLTRSVDTTGVMCGDFHIHSLRSNDARDTEEEKLRAAAADGLEIPGRSEHEYVESWDQTVIDLGLSSFLYGLTSVELTTMEYFGHFGVVPIDERPDEQNGGIPKWQDYPSVFDPDTEFRNLRPPELFSRVLSLPEDPALIVNHPLGGKNYFEFVGMDPVTFTFESEADWDDRFHAVEVFNSDSWLDVRNAHIAYWLSLLDHGVRVYAVGASDSHNQARSPIGWPRTCLEVGVDRPPAAIDERRAFADTVRDAIKDGHMSVSGGIYVDVSVGDAGPGDDATGVGSMATVTVRVQAASWVDVDAIEIIVDGETQEVIEAADFVAGIGSEVHLAEHQVPVASTGSYVLVGVYGDEPLLVHPGRAPFGASNPIFLSP